LRSHANGRQMMHFTVGVSLVVSRTETSALTLNQKSVVFRSVSYVERPLQAELKGWLGSN
jgi:hypothetical protein